MREEQQEQEEEEEDDTLNQLMNSAMFRVDVSVDDFVVPVSQSPIF
jgi:hypothetical protein